MNIFKGSRRIAAALAVAYVAGWVGYSVLNQPYHPVHYLIARPGAIAVPVAKCGDDDATAFPAVKLSNGADADVVLCFPPARADDGEMYIPYESTAGGTRWRGDSEHSDPVRKYTKQVAASFSAPADLIERSNAARWEARVEQVKESSYAVVIGLVAGWIAVVSIGWVVRGFLDIPKGKDAK